MVASIAACAASSSGEAACGRGGRGGPAAATDRQPTAGDRRRPQSRARAAGRRAARCRPRPSSPQSISAPCFSRADRSIAKRRHSASRLAGASGKPPARHRQRIDQRRRQAAAGRARASSAFRKARSNSALWMTSGSSPINADQFVDDRREGRMLGQKLRAEPVHRVGVVRHVALGVDVAVEFAPGRDVVDQLDRGDLDDPVAADAGRARWFRYR